MSLPTILSVEDDADTQMGYTDCLEGSVTVLAAYTVEQGLELFMAYPEIVLVVMDGKVPNAGLTTVALTAMIRSLGFKGPMLATSSHVDLLEQLRVAGCDRTSRKEDVHVLVRRLLGIG